ncbi:hypothetical protein KZZ52_20390 [Dactylosporangium sp. AC04546]|uniref:hypothetical protein n=1 Tax=Dactylosporangium sp. AC04546 TaxID=2862460 RepID=UPI001EDEF0E8|nr:hypothetical protein [Dactylosporangium sp. AC04546]WVK87654.1 hypothetical protein KZZ52_20390 [Dactylosporangium sp. AC04546]
MNVSAATWSVPSAGQQVDPAARRAQVNAQAATLSQLMGSKHGEKVAAAVTNGVGVDLYM